MQSFKFKQREAQAAAPAALSLQKKARAQSMRDIIASPFDRPSGSVARPQDKQQGFAIRQTHGTKALDEEDEKVLAIVHES